MNIGTDSTRPASQRLPPELTPEQSSQGQCWVRQVSTRGIPGRLVRQDVDSDYLFYNLRSGRKRRALQGSEISSVVKRQKQTKCSLLKLPNELLAQCFSYLSPSDIISARLSCKRIQTFVDDLYSDTALIKEAHKLCPAGYTLCFDSIALLRNLYGGEVKERNNRLEKHRIPKKTMSMALNNQYFAEALIHRLISQSKIQWVLKKEISNIPFDRDFSFQSLVLLPRGNIACLCRDNSACESFIQIYSVKNGELLQTLIDHEEMGSQITSLLSLSDGLLVSGDNTGTLKVWNTTTGELKKKLEKKHEGVDLLTKIPNDHFASGASYGDGVIKIWHSKKLCFVKTLKLNKKTLREELEYLDSLATTREGYLAASCEIRQKLFLLDTKKNKCVQEISTCAYCSKPAFLPNGNIAFPCYRSVKILDTNTGEYLHTLGLRGDIYHVSEQAVIAGGHLASVSDDGTVRIWTPETGLCRQTLNNRNPEDTGTIGPHRIASLSAMKDGSLLSSHPHGGKLKHWVMQIRVMQTRLLPLRYQSCNRRSIS